MAYARADKTAKRLELLGIIEMPGRVFSFEESMAILNVCEHTLRRLLNDDELRGFKVGRKWLVSEAAIQEYIRKQETALTP